MSANTRAEAEGHWATKSNDSKVVVQFSPVLSGGPWCEFEIDAVSRQASAQLKVAALTAKVNGLRANVVELFLLLVEIDPDVLPPKWALVHEALVANERYWVYPRATVGDYEEGHPSESAPFINRRRVTAEWNQLLEDAWTNSRG